MRLQLIIQAAKRSIVLYLLFVEHTSLSGLELSWTIACRFNENKYLRMEISNTTRISIISGDNGKRPPIQESIFVDFLKKNTKKINEKK